MGFGLPIYRFKVRWEGETTFVYWSVLTASSMWLYLEYARHLPYTVGGLEDCKAGVLC